LLSAVPDQKPNVEVPNVQHLSKLAASRPGVFKNFNMNLGDADFFSKDDIEQYTTMFDTFSLADGSLKSLDELKQSMAAKLHPFAKLRPTVQDLDTIIELAAAEREVEPIVHAGQTAEEKKQVRAHYKAKQSEAPRLSRGTKALNAATLRVLQRLEQQHDSRLTKAADHALFVDNVEIVGADSTKKGYETMYLCHWTHEKWAGHAKEFQWVPASTLGNDSESDEDGPHSDESGHEDDHKLAQLQFSDALLHQRIQVHWQNQDGKEKVRLALNLADLHSDPDSNKRCTLVSLCSRALQARLTGSRCNTTMEIQNGCHSAP